MDEGCELERVGAGQVYEDKTVLVWNTTGKIMMQPTATMNESSRLSLAEDSYRK